MPVFSELTLTFDVDAVIGDQFSILVDNNGTISTKGFEFVATRVSAGQVTTGTPTGNAGETTAINFEAAYDLDNPSNYITTVQNTNEVLIQSETEGEDFVALLIDSNDTIRITADYNNYIPPIDNSNIELALVESPFYVSTPFNLDTTKKVNIDIYVWSGDLSNVPSTATRSLTKVRPTIDYEEFNTNLSNIVQDEIELDTVYNLSSTTQILDSPTDGVKWFKFVASYVDPENSIADVEGTFAASDGYGYYNQGINPQQPNDSILTSVRTVRKIPRSGFILLGFMNDGTITSIDISSNNNQINASETITGTNISTDFIQYLMVDVSQASTDEYVTVTFQPSGETVVYQLVDECRYNTKQVVFKNKFGVWDVLSMFKKETTTIEVESDTYIGNFVSNATYDITKHQYKTINVKGKESLTKSSGYISENENELYTQLLLSDLVYFYDSGYVPVNVKTKSLSYKTRVNDTLVNYDIDFEYAYNKKQNV